MITFDYNFDSKVLSTFEYTAPSNKIHEALVDMGYFEGDYGDYLDEMEYYDEKYRDELYEWFEPLAYEQFKELEEYRKDPIKYHGLGHNKTGGIR